MSITTELREWARDNTAQGEVLTTHPVQHPVHGTLESLLAIADRIDAEHQKACDDAWNNGYEADYLGIEKWLTEHPQVMEHHGWVCLPKDADGKHIQPSDIPHLTKANDGKRLAFCPSLELRQDGTWRLAGWTPDRYRISKPTVEGVLMEFADEVRRCCDTADTIAEYAAKLRLAGEGE